MKSITNYPIAKLRGNSVFAKTRCLIACVAIAMLVACISSESVTHQGVPSADAAEQNFQLGAQYYRNGNFALARDRLERATEIDPRYAEAFSLLAMSLVQLDNRRLANEAFIRAVRLEPNNIKIRNAYAVFLCQQGQFDAALEHFDRAIRARENDNAEVMMSNAGVCMVQKPDYAMAEEYFREALRVRPAYAEALIQLASLKHQSDDDLTARAFLQRYLAANKASAAVLYLGVQIETAQGDERAADGYKNRIFTNFPDSAEAKHLLAERQ